MESPVAATASSGAETEVVTPPPATEAEAESTDSAPEATTTAYYKLTYFDYNGVAEPIRYIFSYLEVPFEDVRLAWDDTWEKELKPKTPWGQLPILTVTEADGTQFDLSQSVAICRYLAHKFDLAGKDEWEDARCDELVDQIGDLRDAWIKVFIESPGPRKTEFAHEFIGQSTDVYFQLSKILHQNKNEYTRLVGAQLTWADLLIAYYLDFFEKEYGGTLGSYPLLLKFKEHIEGLPGIAKWFEIRPKLPTY